MDKKTTVRSFAGECIAAEKWEMDIHFIGNDKVKIESRSGSDINVDGHYLQLFSGLKEDSTGAIVIPNDGNAYWFIPINSNVPYRMMAGAPSGGSATTACFCNDGGKGTCDKVTSGNTISCTEKVCSVCCTLVVTVGPFAVASLDVGGIILSASEIELNGVKFSKDDKNYILPSLIGDCKSPQYRVMAIQSSKDIAYVNLQKNGNSVPSNAALWSISLPIQKDGTVFIPNDGKTYWFVPFDENSSPERMIASGAGGEGELTCACTGGSGGCKIDTITDPEKGTFSSFCSLDGCTGCCEGTFTVPTQKILPLGGVIIQANGINVNGKLFQ